MERERLDQYRKQLREMADRVGRTAAALEEQARTPTGGEAAGGLSNAPFHLADVGSEAYNQELGATLLENETYVRDEVLAALTRIDEGRYGRCENCGREIIPERLEALPYARHCTACSAQLGSGRAVNLNSGRPETWLGEPGHEGPTQTGSPQRIVGRDLGGGPDDVHAVGTPGGGTAAGGLAGTNVGGGAPAGAKLERAMGAGVDDAPVDDDGEDLPEAVSGPSGGAVGGTPANKRSRGTRAKAGGNGSKGGNSAKSSGAKKKTRTKKSGD
jgi:RNA polymerase-binding transcription factor DksA